MTNSTFYSNYASVGGAISIYNPDEGIIENTVFKDNIARNYGGALHIDKGSISL